MDVKSAMKRLTEKRLTRSQNRIVLPQNISHQGGNSCGNFAFLKFARCSHATICKITGLLCLCLVFGCTSLDFSKGIPWLDTDAVVKQPAKITTLWNHDVLIQVGRKGVRGFGGRIMFHDKDHERPVKVEGTLTVFAFDISDRVSSVPDRKYVFTEEQFETHYSQSKLGHSYSVWLPWDEVGGEPRRISLMTRFEPKDGKGMIMSEDSLQILPGLTPDPSHENAPKKPSEETELEIQQAGYQKPLRSPGDFNRTSVRTSLTDSDPIELPPSFSRRIGTVDSDLVPAKERPRATAMSPDSYPREGASQNTKPDTSIKSSDRANETRAVSPLEQLRERHQSLEDHFGRRQSQARKASSVRSKPAPAQSQLDQPDEPSPPKRSSSPEPLESFELESSPASANSR